MSARDWTSLIFRIAGIFLILLTLMVLLPRLLGTIIETLMYSEEPGQYVITWLILFCGVVPSLVIGWGLLRRTDWFVDKAFQSVLRMHETEESLVEGDDISGGDEAVGETDAMGVTTEPPTDDTQGEWVLDFPKLHRDDVLAIGMSFMGVWILSSAVPELLEIIVNFFREETTDGSLLGAMDLFVSGAIFSTNSPLYVIARGAIGLWLFLSSYKIVKVWSKQQKHRSIVSHD